MEEKKYRRSVIIIIILAVLLILLSGYIVFDKLNKGKDTRIMSRDSKCSLPDEVYINGNQTAA